ncbi:MAG TPA: hypothetical protein PKC38_08085, partial [Chitinophagales bacterium]|nr:hypothetical protein [Chitinophagales bacterium]
MSVHKGVSCEKREEEIRLILRIHIHRPKTTGISDWIQPYISVIGRVRTIRLLADDGILIQIQTTIRIT